MNVAAQLFLFALMSAASYRLWRLVGYDDITGPARERLDASHPTRSKIYDMVTCPWCLGSWIAFGVVAVTAQVTSVAWPVLQGLAAALAVGWLGTTIEDE